MLRSDQNNAFSCDEILPLIEDTEKIKKNSFVVPGDDSDGAEEFYSTSMCAVNDKFIFVTGGCGDGNIVANCYRFDIDRNLWQEMPSMNKARCSHSSCQLAAHIYVFFGMNGNE